MIIYGIALKKKKVSTDANGNAMLQSFVSKQFKKNSAEDVLVPPLWGKRGGEERLFLISSVHAASRGVICDFTLKIVNTLIENNLMRR